MVMSFFREVASRGSTTSSHQTISMLGDARHSFDLASIAVLSGADPERGRRRHRGTDRRINEAEQQLAVRAGRARHRARQRRHRARCSASRCCSRRSSGSATRRRTSSSSPAKACRSSVPDDIDEFVAHRQADLADVRRGRRPARVAGRRRGAGSSSVGRSSSTTSSARRSASTCSPSEPGSWAVPRAILYRYWKRIVANLAGIVTAAIEPLQNIDYLDDGRTDLDD